jgi:MFS family permease
MNGFRQLHKALAAGRYSAHGRAGRPRAGHTVYDSAATGLLPSLVSGDRLPYANSRLVTTTMLTGQLLGPAVAGLLFAVAPGLPLSIDASSFLVAALLVAVIRVPPTRLRSSPRARTRVRTDVREGLGVLWRDRTLRTMTALIAVLAGVSGALAALLVLYTKQRLHLGSTGYGLLFCCYAIGGLVGCVSAPKMLKGGSAGRPLIVVLTLIVGSFAGLAAPTTVLAAVIALVAFGAAVGLWYVLSASMFQTHAPSRLLGRSRVPTAQRRSPRQRWDRYARASPPTLSAFPIPSSPAHYLSQGQDYSTGLGSRRLN